MPLASPLFRVCEQDWLGIVGLLPLQGMDGTCQASAIEEVPPLDEFQMLTAVTFRPVVVSIAVKDHNNDFADYEGGVYQSGQVRNCVNDHELFVTRRLRLRPLHPQEFLRRRLGDEGYMLLPRDRTCGRHPEYLEMASDWSRCTLCR